MRFDSSMQVLGPFPGFPQSAIREEQSQARVPVAEAERAGPAHRAFLAALPEEWRSDPAVEIFSRMLWLGRGWYPLTPHYHLDWYLESGERVETIMVLLGGNSRTEFVRGPIELPDEPRDPDFSHGRMQRWGEQIAEGVRSGRYQTDSLEPERLILFDNRVWHRARPATEPGFRLLMRAIRGLPPADQSHQNPGRFTTLRNGYYPETEEERLRRQPYGR